jgi:hypothetical protein
MALRALWLALGGFGSQWRAVVNWMLDSFVVDAVHV